MDKIVLTKIKLSKLEREANDTYTFKFALPENIKWEPGAYAHFLCSDMSNGEQLSKELVRKLSIMNHPDESFIGFTTRIRKNPSKFKEKLLNLKVGEDIHLFKFGNVLNKQINNKPIVCISMGVGIAPFRPIILESLKNTSRTALITNINIDRSGEFIYQEEFEKLPKKSLKNVFISNRDNLYSSINQCVENPDNIYYVVGSDEFNKDIGDYLTQKNVTEENIVFDKH